MKKESGLLLGLMAMGALDGMFHKRPDIKEKVKLDGIDIEKEYEKIKRKESSLSKSERDLIIYRYKKQIKDFK